LLLGIAAGFGIVIARDTYGFGKPRPERADAFGRKLISAARRMLRVGGQSSSIPILAFLPNIDVSFGLSAAEDPRSRLAAELRRIHAALHAGQKAGSSCRILVVASDDEDDTVAVALMLGAVAAVTERVLLIDADLDRRTLSAIDADRSDAGLVDVAVGRRDLADIIIRDRETDLSLLPFVALNCRRDQRVSEADIRGALDQTKRFDTVVVAAADLSCNPSTRFFAALVDHIVLVARTESRSADAVESFVARLGRHARKIRGAVLVAGGNT